MSVQQTVLITGHSGFKGTWLSLMLLECGHRVIGCSKNDVEFKQAHYGLFGAELKQEYGNMYRSFNCNILNQSQLNEVIEESRCDSIIHLAAQPLVSYAQENPGLTWATNVQGTYNCIRAAEAAKSRCRSLIISTTDKVYRFPKGGESVVHHSEDDPLGSDEPYGASKAASDIMAQSYSDLHRLKASGLQITIIRAGNVIGGGDLSRYRLLPDLYRSTFCEMPLSIRNPNALRPWQHVLDCCMGYYLALTAYSSARTLSRVYNIGPNVEDIRTVRDIIDVWPGTQAAIRYQTKPLFTEQKYLSLSSDKAKRELGWRPRITFEKSVSLCYDVYARLAKNRLPLRAMIEQTRSYLEAL